MVSSCVSSCAGIRDKINVFKFERDTLERAGLTDSATPIPPFLVVASNDINEELNAGDPPVFWPERRYPWGTAEAFNRDHSDLLALRCGCSSHDCPMWLTRLAIESSCQVSLPFIKADLPGFPSGKPTTGSLLHECL